MKEQDSFLTQLQLANNLYEEREKNRLHWAKKIMEFLSLSAESHDAPGELYVVMRKVFFMPRTQFHIHK